MLYIILVFNASLFDYVSEYTYIPLFSFNEIIGIQKLEDPVLKIISDYIPEYIVPPNNIYIQQYNNKSNNFQNIHPFGIHKCIVQNDCQLYLSEMPYFTNQSVIIAGMVKNAEKSIKRLLQQMDEISCVFNNTIFIIYESNSDDNTTKLLNKWSLFNVSNGLMKYCNFMKWRHKKNNLTSQANLFFPKRMSRKWTLPFNAFSKNESKYFDNINKYKSSLIQKYIISNTFDDILKNDNEWRLYSANITNITNSTSSTRVSYFIRLRNMLLSKISSIINDKYPLIDFNYLMLVDFDVYELDAHKMLYELYHLNKYGANISNYIDNTYTNWLVPQTQILLNKYGKNIDNEIDIDIDIGINIKMNDHDITNINNMHLNEFPLNSEYFVGLNDSNKMSSYVMCVNGLHVPTFMHDVFATVLDDGQWLFEYQPALDDHRLDLQNIINQRYYEVKSCFGGIAIYNSPKYLLKSNKCKYITLESIQSSDNNKSSLWYDKNKNELNKFQINYKKYFWRKDKYYFKKDYHICEHLGFHYCIKNELNYNIYISRNATLWYHDLKYMLEHMILECKPSKFSKPNCSGYLDYLKNYLDIYYKKFVNHICKWKKLNKKIRKKYCTTGTGKKKKVKVGGSSMLH